MLIKKLKELRPKKPKAEAKGQPALEKDEFIGQDEYIDVTSADSIDDFPEIITQIEYEAEVHEGMQILLFYNSN